MPADFTSYSYAPSSSYASTYIHSSSLSQTPPLLVNSNSQEASSSVIYVHVDAGHIFQLLLGDKCKEIIGPATVKIVSNDSTQPVPLQLTSPAPGQFVQRLLDESGMINHLIISSQPHFHPQPHHHHHHHFDGGGGAGPPNLADVEEVVNCACFFVV